MPGKVTTISVPKDLYKEDSYKKVIKHKLRVNLYKISQESIKEIIDQLESGSTVGISKHFKRQYKSSLIKNLLNKKLNSK